jgi:hypothetical protein
MFKRDGGGGGVKFGEMGVATTGVATTGVPSDNPFVEMDLIKYDLDPTRKNSKEETDLHLNCSVEELEEDSMNKIKVLLDAGADVNAIDDEGNTPLHNACFESHLEIVRLLLESGANVNAKNYEQPFWYGHTPLHYAAGSKNNVEIIGLLLNSGADINAKDYEGDTPLHIACHQGKLENVRLLLDKIGLNVDIKPLFPYGFGKNDEHNFNNEDATKLLEEHHRQYEELRKAQSRLELLSGSGDTAASETHSQEQAAGGAAAPMMQSVPVPKGKSAGDVDVGPEAQVRYAWKRGMTEEEKVQSKQAGIDAAGALDQEILARIASNFK